MSSFKRSYTITEHSSFSRGVEIPGYQALPVEVFDNLEEFILANHSTTETDPIELLGLSARRGIGKIITARNYVGVITLSDGTVIEILPKIAGRTVTEQETKRIFLEMLCSRTLICRILISPNLPYLKFL